jgi:hypothetical protein
VAVELRQINLDDLPDDDVEQLTARGRGLRWWLCEQDPSVRVEAGSMMQSLCSQGFLVRLSFIHSLHTK